MDNLHQLSPGCVKATYTAQRLPQYKGNPLIEALPPSMSDASLAEALELSPEFDPEQREWETFERFQMLTSLSTFCVPLSRHIELARALDSLMRSGYVGRAPRTAGHAQIYQRLYDNQKKGITFSQSATSIVTQKSTSLIGISGMGKTTTVDRFTAHIPKVIYHGENDLNLYQIPYLHVEMPSDGSSIKGLAIAILHQLDSLIPGANYYEEYAVRGKPGADVMMRNVARVLNTHLVGLLICDEVQNLSNSHKGAQTVMTELVSATNELKCPILFIGTNKATQILGLDFRTARRATGYGIATWDRLREVEADGESSEWTRFLIELWKFQWVRKPVPFNAHFAQVMYYYSQGVIDIAIKLFASAQARAMLDQSETLTAELLVDVYNRELKLMHPMIDALRDDDIAKLSLYDDIAPIGLKEILKGMDMKLKSKASPLYSVKSTEGNYIDRIAKGLTSMGFGEEDALQAAVGTLEEGKLLSVLEGAQKAMKALTTPKKTSKKKDTPEAFEVVSFDDRPNDYRRAIQAAHLKKSDVLTEMKELGLAPQLEELFDF
ncbi:AAA domain-containing protein [Rhodoferax sp. OV413]|uniref:AAA family ATPase n=1 Tax=Rhodoferax sp. OV413 TaxID=1855285 RepID=UPI000890FAA4|nr:AAA family ATPase [Rhodoferax sp. OV413]SDP92886.1 AAA domain-containing protein [Rhodoferax sp. OV413]